MVVWAIRAILELLHEAVFPSNPPNGADSLGLPASFTVILRLVTGQVQENRDAFTGSSQWSS